MSYISRSHNKELENKYDIKKVKKKIIKTAGPVFVELVVSSLFGMIDMMMLGNIADKVVSASSVATIGITNQMVFLGLSLVQALTIGGTTMISRYLGAGENHRLEGVLKHVVIMSLLFIAIPVVLLSQIFPIEIMKIIGATPEVLEHGTGYFRIICGFFFLQCYNISLFASLRGVQDTKSPMKINLIANSLNVVGNYILIYGKLGFPSLGVVGAAISTVVSQFIASVLVTIYVLKKENKIKVNLKHKFSIEAKTMKNLINIGIPASLEQLALRGGLFLFVRLVTSLGTFVFAAHQICISILSLSFTTGQSLGISASALVGHALGAKDKDLARLYIRETKIIGFFISLFVGAVLVFYGRPIVELYTEDVEIIDMSVKVLMIVGFVQPFQTVQLLTAGGLRGAGDTFYPLITTAVGILCLRTIVGYTLVYVYQMGLIGAWIGVVVDQLTRSFLIERRFKTDKWQGIKIY